MGPKKLRRKTNNLGERGLPRPWHPPWAEHGTHHGMTTVVTGGTCCYFSSVTSCGFVLDHGICDGMLVLGCCRPPSLASLIIKALEIIRLSIHLGLKGSNPKSKPNKQTPSVIEKTGV